MSITYNAGLIYGWRITKEEYDSLDEAIKEDYTINTDEICDQGQYFIGYIQAETYCGYSFAHPVDEMPDMPSDVYDLIEKALPDVLYRLPNPTLYLYCRVW